MDFRRTMPTLLRCISVIVPVCILTLLGLHLLSITPTTTIPHSSKVPESIGADHAVSSKLNHSPWSTFHVVGESKAFLGPRPDAQMVANASNILKGCNSMGDNGWRDTSHCVEYLRYHESDYLGHTSEPTTTCDRAHAVRYHTYWRGPLTWRVSFMLKSWLYTQNLACSEMHIWLDADFDANTVSDALASPVLQPFLPMLQSGLIHLRAWSYPSKVYIPPEHQEDDFPPDNMMRLRQHQIPRGPVAVSDSVRFVILHQEGGLYVDMDTMFLKDVRPLLIAPNLSFAERWGAHPGPGEYNTAYLRLQPLSALSSRILQGAARMGLNFHPRVIGRMLAKTTIMHANDLVMFETGVFDPLWSFFDHDNIGNCTVPCMSDFTQFYSKRPILDEWSMLRDEDALPRAPSQGNTNVETFNRTLSNFFRGTFVHHIHNQWRKQVVPGSWVWVADQTYNQFLSGQRPNPYGEYWSTKIDFTLEEAGYRA